jgi:peptidyl-prolyl cis-trans isomerase D
MKDGINLQRTFSLLFVLGISVVFILQFGPGSRGCDAPLTQTSSDAAAVVNGEEVPMKDFVRTYSNQMQYFRGQKGMELMVAQMVLRQMINTELLAQAAHRHGIEASDAELRKVIHNDPNFQKDGKFDYATYEMVVRDYLKKSAPQFEADLRRQLTAGKMLDLVANGATVSDDEVKARFLKEGDKAKATYVRFLPSMFADQVPAPKPDDVKAWAAAHQKEIEAYYKDNQFLYHQPEKVKARHILVKVDKDAPGSEKDAAKKKAEQIRADISAGKIDFAAAAKQYSDDPGSKSQGGELGFNEKGAWVKEFSDAAFGLKPGEISQPVETQFGFHLIQAEEKKPAEDKKLDDVKGEIALSLLKKEKAQAIARKQADEALAKAKAGKALTDLFPPSKAEGTMRFEAEDKPAAVDTGDFALEGDSVPQLGPAPALSKAIFATKAPGLLEEVYPQGDGFVVAQVTGRTLPTDSEFASQKEKLRGDALKAKQDELRESFIKALHDKAKIVTNEAAIGQLAHSS